MMRDYASKIATWIGLMVTALLLTACAGPTLRQDPCTPQRCGVPHPVSSPIGDPAAEYVPLCEDVDEGAGPCVMGDEGAWYYVAAGSRYPDGRARIAGCAVEDGGPVPCVWVPSVMDNQQGDSGAYVYR